MSMWSGLSDDHPHLVGLLHLLLVATCCCLVFFFYKTRNMALWKHLESAKSNVLVLHGILLMLMIVFLINSVVSPYNMLMPLSPLSNRMEDWANGNSFVELTQSSLNHYAWYNAVVCTVLLVGLLIAYGRILTTSYVCMDSIGGILLEQSKEKDMELAPATLVTFDLEEPELPHRPRTRMKKVHQVGLMAGLFGLTVLLLPNAAQNTFAYTIVDGEAFDVTSDHLLATFTMFLVVKLCRDLCYNFANIPHGFSRAKFAASQFSLVYGCLLVMAATLFLSLANDVMFTYIYKVYVLYQERVKHPHAMAHDIFLENANYCTSSFANYLVDCTYTAVDSNMTREEVFHLFRVLVASYKNLYIDLVQVMFFGLMVFVPGVMGSLVLFSQDI